MKFIGIFVRWVLVGLALIFLYQTAIAQAYLEALSLLLAILLLIPGVGDRLSEKIPFLRSSFLRSFLGLSLLIFTVASFGKLTLQNRENSAQQQMALLGITEIIREQKSYYLENGRFSDSFKARPMNYKVYRYTMTVDNTITPETVTITAAPYPQSRLRSYTGVVLSDKQNSTTESIICQTRFISPVPPEVPKISDPKQQKLTCPGNAEIAHP